MGVLSVLAVIGIVICMIINLVIYHKIFSVTYFNLGKGCFTEIFFAWFVAMFEMGIILAIGKFILGGILKLLGFAGKIIIIVLVIFLVLFIVSKIVQLIKGENAEEADKGKDDFIQNNEMDKDEKEASETEASETEPLEGEVVACDTETEKTGQEIDIELVEVGSNKVKVIRAICDTTGLGLAEVKNIVESSAKTLKGVSKEKADSVKAKLEAEGAKVVLRMLRESAAMRENQNSIHMMACTNCGKEINENAKFCNFCGNKIIKMDMAVCENCGNPITVNANFCHYCGEKIKKG